MIIALSLKYILAELKLHILIRHSVNVKRMSLKVDYIH
jgi:hypothetical protein